MKPKHVVEVAQLI